MYTVDVGVTEDQAHEALDAMATLDPLGGWFKIFELIGHECEATIKDEKLLQLLKECDVIVVSTKASVPRSPRHPPPPFTRAFHC